MPEFTCGEKENDICTSEHKKWRILVLNNLIFCMCAISLDSWGFYVCPWALGDSLLGQTKEQQ